MKSGTELTNDFEGVALNVGRARIPAGRFQVDLGGDRFKKGSWLRRRGYRHTDVAQGSSAVTTLLGIELPGEDYALLLVEGANAHGFENVAEQ